MRLWTEYEGETIDGAFPLKRLLLPEGRSAFFSTANGQGDPAMLRLIECHFDEEEILARWRCVEALNHPNFLRLERYGQIELDGGPAVYALFERVDANLGQVLCIGPLNAKEAAQIASSLVAALEMLHTHGFVHEHVEPQNVFAVGEAVKLRSDCIREAPEGQAGVDAKQRDIRDLAALVFRTLAPQEILDAQRITALPVPFDKLVRNGMNGTWGLAEMRAALEGRARPAPAASVITSRQTPPAPAAPSRQTAPAQKPLSAPTPGGTSKNNENKTPKWGGNVAGSAVRQELWQQPSDRNFSVRSVLKSKWSGIAVMLAVLFLMGRLVEHEWHEARSPRGPAPASASLPAASVHQQFRAAHARPAGSAAAGNRLPHEVGGPQARTQWRVIAYTYDRADQARKKAATLAGLHPNLHPEVFTPSGHAPYLVTVGGVMNRDQAVALARQLRRRGLPRDTYAQNYAAGTSAVEN